MRLEARTCCESGQICAVPVSTGCIRAGSFVQANAKTNAPINARPTRRHIKTHQDARHLGLQLLQLFTTNSCARVLLGERESGRAR